MSIKDDVKGLKFHRLSKDNNLKLICDYCRKAAIGVYVNEDDNYDYIDVCEEHYKESLE